MQLTVVLVFKGILEKYQFLVGLPDKTCIGFESDIFSDLTLTFEKAAKVVLNSKKKKKIKILMFRLSTSQTS